jgi:hypothetical protein
MQESKVLTDFWIRIEDGYDLNMKYLPQIHVLNTLCLQVALF